MRVECSRSIKLLTSRLWFMTTILLSSMMRLTVISNSLSLVMLLVERSIALNAEACMRSRWKSLITKSLVIISFRLSQLFEEPCFGFLGDRLAQIFFFDLIGFSHVTFFFQYILIYPFDERAKNTRSQHLIDFSRQLVQSLLHTYFGNGVIDESLYFLNILRINEVHFFLLGLFVLLALGLERQIV